MASHTHLARGVRPEYVTPDDVENLRDARSHIRPDSPLRTVLDDLLLALCASATIPADLVVDITRQCNHQTGA
jgi:hypothetical protein